MLTKPVLLTLLVACSVHPSEAAEPPAEQPDEWQRPDTPEENQHFCCQDVDPKALMGEGCTAISGSLETINACANVLYCPGAWTKQDGKVECSQ